MYVANEDVASCMRMQDQLW